MSRLLAVLALVLVVPAPAAARDLLHIGPAAVDPDRRVLVATVTCDGSPRACHGRLRGLAYWGGPPFTAARSVHLRPGRARRITLRLLPDGLRRLGGDLGDGRVFGLELGAGTGDGSLRLDATCASGRTLASSATVRVFRVVGFGPYGCLRPAGRPLELAPSTPSQEFEAVTGTQVAGHMVAVVSTGGEKCTDSSIAVFDVRARRRLRERAVSTTVASDANGCDSTGDVAQLVLRASGSVAYGETAGDDGLAVIRALDAGGARTLARGKGVDPGSLRSLDATTVAWTEDGAQRTAALR